MISFFKQREAKFAPIALIIFTGLVVRLLLIGNVGNAGDLGLFASWSQRLQETTFARFYHPDFFCDYLPGYLYILWAIGRIQAATGANYHVLLKFPAIAADIALCLFIYIAARKDGNEKKALIGASAAIFNPMSIYNSSVWGQIDSVLALFLIVSIYFASEGRFELAASFYGIAAVIKPQSMFLAFAFFFIFLEKLPTGPLRWTIKLFKCILAFASTAYLLALPFAPTFNPSWIISLYANVMSEYSYVSMNAYNLWWLFGIHWVSDSVRLWLFSYNAWGYISVAFLIMSSLAIFLKCEGRSKIPYAAALIHTAIFMACCRMHERYLFPSVFFLLLAYTYDKDPFTLALAALFSVTNALNLEGALHWAGRLFGLRTGISAANAVLMLSAFALFILRAARTPKERLKNAG
ncbi:MAG: hypothetical protein LBU32_29195 [Clostridiales bacterium]|jgi:Gpi18-like mannosyltransferase|nr:hypothetical protein [Clostridiales bacterium]